MPTPSTSNFIDKAKLVHNGLYTYENTIILKRKEPVTITCKVHGDFKQLAGNHLKGMGCPTCGKERSAQSSALKAQKAAEKFIADARGKHGDKYDYSRVVYKNCKTNVAIVCPTHGEFEQTPSNHLNKNNTCGCPKCGRESSLSATLQDKEVHAERLRKLTEKRNQQAREEFVVNAKKIHGDYYDYSQVVYKQCRVPVTIVCPKHGAFEQRPNNHLKGRGCPICAHSLGERAVWLWLTERDIEFRTQVTIPEYSITKRFDFYVPSIDTYIEYDGRQHFEPISHFGGEKRFLEQRERDIRTNEWCAANGVKLIRISYLENVQERLSNIFFGVIDHWRRSVLED